MVAKSRGMELSILVILGKMKEVAINFQYSDRR